MDLLFSIQLLLRVICSVKLIAIISVVTDISSPHCGASQIKFIHAYHAQLPCSPQETNTLRTYCSLNRYKLHVKLAPKTNDHRLRLGLSQKPIEPFGVSAVVFGLAYLFYGIEQKCLSWLIINLQNLLKKGLPST